MIYLLQARKSLGVLKEERTTMLIENNEYGGDLRQHVNKQSTCIKNYINDYAAPCCTR